MLVEWTLLLLPVAAASGWLAAKRKYKGIRTVGDQQQKKSLRRDYFVGLNYLINEQPDKAVDVFVRMVQVDSDTVETHLALGNLFRRRGEVDRAIRVHQNLIARPQLSRVLRVHALFELAQDYMKAGVLNRAEKLFLELVDMGEERLGSLRHLLHIYQQQKEWQQAIVTAKKLEIISGGRLNVPIAHFNCELTEEAIQANDLPLAEKYLKQALYADSHSVRVSIKKAELAKQKSDWQAAIMYYKKVESQDPDYLPDVLEALGECYQQLDQQEMYVSYIVYCLEQHPHLPISHLLTAKICRDQVRDELISILLEQVQSKPSLQQMTHLLELYASDVVDDIKDRFHILHQGVTKLIGKEPKYRCVQCGFSSEMIYWQCPSCKGWSVVKPALHVDPL